MIKIKSMKDIENLRSENSLPKELLALLSEELLAAKEWSDEFNESTIEEFNSEDYDFGYIVILDGTETVAELEQDIGLTGGLDQVIPEVAINHYISGDKYTKLIVVYNDSYSMSIWLKNNDMFDSYAVAA